MINQQYKTNKKVKNGIRNGYQQADKLPKYVYFARANINSISLIKIGAYNGRYNILTNLKSRYNATFKLVKRIENKAPYTEQELHIAFKELNYSIIYNQYSRCSSEITHHITKNRSTEFFIATSKLLEFIEQLPHS